MTYPNVNLHIDGKWRASHSGRTIAVLNPATEETIGTVAHADKSDLDEALAAADKGFRVWRAIAPFERAKVMRKAAALMRERADAIAPLMTMEQGKTLAEARIEVMMNVSLFNFYAGEVFRLYGRALVRPVGQRSTVTKEPVGPVAAFAPWNFPLGNPGRKLGAPIAAGRLQPMPPPRRPKKLCASLLLISVRAPGAEDRISSSTTASLGSMAPIASSKASGCTGVWPASARAFSFSA